MNRRLGCVRSATAAEASCRDRLQKVLAGPQPRPSPLFCEASRTALTSTGTGRRISPATDPRPPRVLHPAGHRQLLALLLFIPDLNAPFIFPPFKTWPGPRHCHCKHGPRDLSDGALTPAPRLTNHVAACADSGQPSQRGRACPGGTGQRRPPRGAWRLTPPCPLPTI